MGHSNSRMRYLLFLLLVVAASAQSSIPLPTPSVATMELQSGTIPDEWAAAKIAEYEAHGCTYIGVSRVNRRNVNVWCVRVEVFRH